jgi:hypothetical protein
MSTSIGTRSVEVTPAEAATAAEAAAAAGAAAAAAAAGAVTAPPFMEVFIGAVEVSMQVGNVQNGERSDVKLE